MIRSLAVALLFVVFSPSAALAAPPGPYHLKLVVNPAAPFPFLGKFGEVELDVFAGGVRGSATLVRGFSTVGSGVVNVELPLSRIASQVKVSDIRPILAKLAGTSSTISVAPLHILPKVLKGTVKGIPATRYTIVLGGPANTMDIWTTDRIPRNAQLVRLEEQFISAISPSAAATLKRLPGTPIYIELNTVNHKKLPLMKMESYSTSAADEQDALTAGSFFVDVPVSDIMKKVLGFQ